MSEEDQDEEEDDLEQVNNDQKDASLSQQQQKQPIISSENSPQDQQKPDPYVPKIEYFTEQDYKLLLDKYNQQFKSNDPYSYFLTKFGISVTIEKLNKFLDQGDIEEELALFYLNILSNEDFIRQPKKGLFLFAIKIDISKIDDIKDGNEDDEEEDDQENEVYSIIDTYVDCMLQKEFLIDNLKFIVLMIFIENRWLICLIDIPHLTGVLTDFKTTQTVELYKVKRVLTQVFKATCEIDITRYQIESQMFSNLQDGGNCGHLCLNYVYKLIMDNSSPVFSDYRFDKKDKNILKLRFVWIILKMHQQINDPENYAKSLSHRSLPSLQSQHSTKQDNTGEETQQKSNRTNESAKQDGVAQNLKKTDDNINNGGRFYPHPWDFSDISEADQKQMQYEHDQLLQLQLEEIKQKKLQKKLEYGDFDDSNESEDPYSKLPPHLRGPPKKPQKQLEQYDQLQYLDSGWELFNPDNKKQEKIFQENWQFQGVKAVPYGPNFVNLKKIKKKGKHKDTAGEEGQVYPQKSRKQILENKIIDVLAALESDPDLIKKLQMERPGVAWLLQQLKNKLQPIEDLPDYQLLPIHLQNTEKESHKILNQYLQSGAADDLLQLQEQQRKLAQLLQIKEQKFEQDPQLQKVDNKFKELFGFYDTLQFLENYNQQHYPKRYIALKPKLLDIKQTIHIELQNYLLSGLGLPGNLSRAKEILDEVPNGGQFNVGFKNRGVMSEQQADAIEQRQQLLQKGNKLPPIQQMQNKSEVLFSNKFVQQQLPQQIRNNSSIASLAPQWQNELEQEIKQKNAAVTRVAERYGLTILQKDIDDVFSQNFVSQKLMNFFIGFLDEKHNYLIGLPQQIERQLRFLLLPTKFFNLLTNGNPNISKINFAAVQDFTARFNGPNKSIFNQIDALVVPIYFIHHEYALILVDLNKRFIQYLGLYRNSDNYNEQQDIQIMDHIEQYLQMEYKVRYLKGYQALGFRYKYIQGKNYQVPDVNMTAFYLIHFLRKIVRGNRSFDEMMEKDIRFIKNGLKQMIQMVGKTLNKKGEIKNFDDIVL